MISLNQLNYKIGDASILSDVTTALPQGQITALIGPNGAGKSSLLNIIARQTTATRGTVEIDGLDVTKTDPRILAHKMAIVSQHVGVASRLRVRDLIGFGRWPHNQGRPTQIDVDKIDEALRQFDLEALAHRFVDELSGGQRQRAFVAMGFVQDTDWVLLDEPLNNLDLRHARALMAHLKQMSAQHGKSIVIVLHDLNFAMSWADHIVALKEGEVAFAGPTREVANTSSLSELYGTDVQIHVHGSQLFVAHHGSV